MATAAAAAAPPVASASDRLFTPCPPRRAVKSCAAGAGPARRPAVQPQAGGGGGAGCRHVQNQRILGHGPGVPLVCRTGPRPGAASGKRGRGAGEERRCPAMPGRVPAASVVQAAGRPAQLAVLACAGGAWPPAGIARRPPSHGMPSCSIPGTSADPPANTVVLLAASRGAPMRAVKVGSAAIGQTRRSASAPGGSQGGACTCRRRAAP